MSRMGCYVLIKIHRNRGFIDEFSYKARQYTVYSYSQKTYPEDAAVSLVHNNHWRIDFNEHEIIAIKFDKQKDYYYHRYLESTQSRGITITKYLADCRFDLVYEHLNKQYG